MTKEELEKEATEYAQKLGAKDFIAKPKEIVAYFGYLAGAEPREKQIAELSKHIVELQNDKGELIDRCRELEAQIEKMKCCVNCRYCINEKCPWQPKGCGMKHWELRR